MTQTRKQSFPENFSGQCCDGIAVSLQWKHRPLDLESTATIVPLSSLLLHNCNPSLQCCQQLAPHIRR